MTSDVKEQVFRPVLPDDWNVSLADGSSVADKLEEWGSSGVDTICAHMLPHEIAQLIVHGLFSTTIVLGRNRLIGQLLDYNNMDIEEWADNSKPVHMTAS